MYDPVNTSGSQKNDVSGFRVVILHQCRVAKRSRKVNVEDGSFWGIPSHQANLCNISVQKIKQLLWRYTPSWLTWPQLDSHFSDISSNLPDRLSCFMSLHLKKSIRLFSPGWLHHRKWLPKSRSLQREAPGRLETLGPSLQSCHHGDKDSVDQKIVSCKKISTKLKRKNYSWWVISCDEFGIFVSFGVDAMLLLLLLLLRLLAHLLLRGPHTRDMFQQSVALRMPKPVITFVEFVVGAQKEAPWYYTKQL